MKDLGSDYNTWIVDQIGEGNFQIVLGTYAEFFDVFSCLSAWCLAFLCFWHWVLSIWMMSYSEVDSILLVLFPIIRVAILSLVISKGGYTTTILS
jgi:hypothetical protein